MKYIAENNRKFTDMGGVKIYHSIFPVRLSAEEKSWGPVIRFDNKVLLPGRQEVQHFIGTPVQVIRVAINGSADYFDSWGYRTVIGEQAALSVISGNEVLSAVLQNNDDQIDTEILEIWFLAGREDNNYQFHSGPINREKGKFYTLITTGDNEGSSTEQKKIFRIGTFSAGTKQQISGIAAGHRLVFFVFNGEVTANGQLLNYRDTALFADGGNIDLEFKMDTNLFMMEIGQEVSGI
jgi:redox-sensitive bicupin YhaK (pirin superfamily)